VSRDTLSRSAIHRFLLQQGLSRPAGSSSIPEEHRRFVAEYANSIWYGDVMHGPTLTLKTGRCKVFLVSLMDDASRLLAHSAFCTNETALAIEVSYSKDFKKEAGILKIELLNTTKSPNRWRYSRYEEA
jgi:putative transposase